MTIQREALIDELKRVSKIVRRSPTEQDMLTHGRFAYSTYFRYFESWTAAKELAGVGKSSNNKISDEKLIRELYRVELLVAGSPTRREIDKLGEYPSSTYKHRFGSWNNALKVAGLPLNNLPPRKHSDSLWYGPEWAERRQTVLERDGYQCRICEYESSQFGHSLHVHHIQPLREFKQSDGEIDWESAHRMENLVALCPHCHKTHESKHCNCSADEFVQRIREKRLTRD